MRTISPGTKRTEQPATSTFVSTTTFTDGGLSVLPEFQRRFLRGRVVVSTGLGQIAVPPMPQQRPRLSAGFTAASALPDSGFCCRWTIRLLLPSRGETLSSVARCECIVGVQTWPQAPTRPALYD